MRWSIGKNWWVNGSRRDLCSDYRRFCHNCVPRCYCFGLYVGFAHKFYLVYSQEGVIFGFLNGVLIFNFLGRLVYSFSWNMKSYLKSYHNS